MRSFSKDCEKLLKENWNLIIEQFLKENNYHAIFLFFKLIETENPIEIIGFLK